VSVLTDHDLNDYLADGILTITPLDPGQVQPGSVDLRLGRLIKIDDPNADGGWRDHDLINDGPYRLFQGEFILAATLERVVLPNVLAAVLAGKSSCARRGIQVEAAGWVDPGWDGELTFEITRFRRGASILEMGMPIAQIVFLSTLSPADKPYGHKDRQSKYQGSRGPVPSRGTP
jgi:dCTP deaminase